MMTIVASKKTTSSVVGFPLYQGATLVDFAGATQVFAFAFAGGFQPIWIAEKIEPIVTTERVKVLPDETFDSAPVIDILFVPGGDGNAIAKTMFDAAFQRFLNKASDTAQWCGGVCVGAFILAAAGLLDNCRATTYWSQLPNLRLLRDKLGIEVADGFPRSVIDEDKRRFTGGGVSSSIDLALELVSRISGVQVAESAQLNIQYAPDPPVHAGDPSQASVELVERTRQAQEGPFIAPVRDAVNRLLQTI